MPLFPIDAGWLLLIPGLALLALTALAPAWVDLVDARHARDRVLAREAWQQERQERTRTLLAAIEARDLAVMARLAAVQRNTLPDGRATLPGLEPERLPNADLSAWITPPPIVEPARGALHPVVATFASFGARLWLIALGGMLVVAGLIGWIRPAPRPTTAFAAPPTRAAG
ncbi:MAG: hypothetical protein AAGK04_02715 [Planctomycetota bacterium]